jgi:hypothetical protein
MGTCCPTKARRQPRVVRLQCFFATLVVVVVVCIGGLMIVASHTGHDASFFMGNARQHNSPVDAAYWATQNTGVLLPTLLETAERALDVDECASHRPLSVVLPMTARDLPRFALLWMSLRSFMRFEDVQLILIVAPRADVAAIVAAVIATDDVPLRVVVDDGNDDFRDNYDVVDVDVDVGGGSSGGGDTCRRGEIHVISDESVAPVYASFPWNLPLLNRFHGPGWRRQQLLKLAVADLRGSARIRTRFYLLLDADVLMVRRGGARQLIHAGKAVTNMESAASHPSWWHGSAAVLGTQPLTTTMTTMMTTATTTTTTMTTTTTTTATSAPTTTVGGSKGSRNVFGVTPAVLHTNTVRALLAFVEQRHHRAWSSVLAHNLLWTEYSLYYAFAHASHLFRRFHHATKDAVYQGANVWRGNEVSPFFVGAAATALRLFCTHADDEGDAAAAAPELAQSPFTGVGFNGSGPFMILNDGATDSGGFSPADINALVVPYVDKRRRGATCAIWRRDHRKV